MARGDKKGGKTTKVAKVGVKKESGFLYFVDKKGDISRAIMSRGGTNKKPSKKVAIKAVKKVVKNKKVAKKACATKACKKATKKFKRK